jgi:hypothetical protein
MSAETLHRPSVAPSQEQTLLPHTTTEPETRLQSRIAIRTGMFGLTWRTAASAANLGPTQASLASIGRFGYRMYQASGQTNGGAKAERNIQGEEERGRVRCAELHGFA